MDITITILAIGAVYVIVSAWKWAFENSDKSGESK